MPGVDVESAFVERWKSKGALSELLPATKVYCGDEQRWDPPHVMVRNSFSALYRRASDGMRADDVTIDCEVVGRTKSEARKVAHAMASWVDDPGPGLGGFDLDEFVGYKTGQLLLFQHVNTSSEKDPENGVWIYFVTFVVRERVR